VSHESKFTLNSIVTLAPKKNYLIHQLSELEPMNKIATTTDHRTYAYGRLGLFFRTMRWGMDDWIKTGRGGDKLNVWE
jgi:photosystem II stability/assembly factor-like uncharacterized protein